MATTRQVLIVEDEPPIRELLRLHLELVGFNVSEVADGRAALDVIRSRPFDLIVLDVMLPGVDGITLCRAARAEGANVSTPLLMLTARDTESDKVLGLESGADDYLTKPFGMRELMARVSALLRRATRADRPAEAPPPRHLAFRNLAIDVDKRQVVAHGHPVDLTRQEFDLLQLLASRPGIVFSRMALLTKVWSGDEYVTERTVDTVVSRLRKKIERETLRLDRIVKDLLDLARLEQGGVTLDVRLFAIRRVFDHVIARHEFDAEARRVSIDAAVTDDADQVLGDPHRIEQVVENLVANALRHTPDRGSIELRAESANGAIVISVADSGTGVPPEHLPYVFDRFYKVDEARTNGSGGSGLGLSIAKAIVERHGGTIGLASQPGRTVFTITLPQTLDGSAYSTSANL